MPRSILLVFLLIGTVCAMHLEYLKVDDMDEKNLRESWPIAKAIVQTVAQADDAEVQAEGQLPGMCWACKWAMTKLKKHIGSKEKVEVIKAKLLKVCDGIGLLKAVCVKLIKKNMDVLTEELSTDDDPRTICTNIGACKPKPPPQLVQAFQEIQQML